MAPLSCLLGLAVAWIHFTCCVCQEQCMNDSGSATPDFELSAEKRLTKHLLGNYMWAGRDGRPVRQSKRATMVDMMLGLINIELDESDKVLTTSMWARMQWQDEYLTWDPQLYDDLEVARIESFNVWTPDIMLYNTAEPESKVRNSMIMAHPDGKLVWVLHQIFKSSCSVNVTDFPFDTQVCHMWSGSWTHNSHEIDMSFLTGRVCHMWFGSWTHKSHEIDLSFLHPDGIDLGNFQADYKDSCEWDIIRTHAQKITPSNISVLTFEIHMQRKMVFSSYILTLPCVFLAALTLVVFCLPPERPDRTGLSMNIFSSFLVLLLILVEAAPSSASSVPKLGIYYCFNMVIIMMSIFLSSLVVNIHRTDASTARVPGWVRTIFFRGLGRCFMLCEPRSQCRKPTKKWMATDSETGCPYEEETLLSSQLEAIPKTACLRPSPKLNKQKQNGGITSSNFISQNGGLISGDLEMQSKVRLSDNEDPDRSTAETYSGGVYIGGLECDLQENKRQCNDCLNSAGDLDLAESDTFKRNESSKVTDTNIDPYTLTSGEIGDSDTNSQPNLYKNSFMKSHHASKIGNNSKGQVFSALSDTLLRTANMSRKMNPIPTYHSAQRPQSSSKRSTKSRSDNVNTSAGTIESLLRDISSDLRQLEVIASAKGRETLRQRSVVSEWRHLAKVLDRIFVILYFVAITVSLVFMFPKPPPIRV